jgi:hypothetical protein
MIFFPIPRFPEGNRTLVRQRSDTTPAPLAAGKSAPLPKVPHVGPWAGSGLLDSFVVC